jgi:hypothetical protein
MAEWICAFCALSRLFLHFLELPTIPSPSDTDAPTLSQKPSPRQFSPNCNWGPPSAADALDRLSPDGNVRPIGRYGTNREFIISLELGDYRSAL